MLSRSRILLRRTRSIQLGHFFTSPQQFSGQKSANSRAVERREDEKSSSYASFVEPYRIEGLNITQNIEKVEKTGSIFNEYALGVFDKDLLNFPFMLRTRQEFLQLGEQYEMIRSSFNRITKDEDTLAALGYKSLHKLSVSEMAHAFEAIGASVQKQFSFGTKEDDELRKEKKMDRVFGVNFYEKQIQVSETAFESFHDARVNIETIIPLIMHNAVVHYAIRNSPNETLKEYFAENATKIGFAMCEPGVEQSSDYEHWSSEAKLTYDSNAWVINGQKNKVIAGDYDQYLICCRTENFDEKQSFDENADRGIVLLLVPKEELTFEDDFTDMFGVKYQKITFKDVKIDRATCEIVKAQKNISDFLNIKGCGNLASSAVLIGMMKQLLKNTYAHLVNEKLGLVNCELVQFRLYEATAKIYAAESMLYMTAAMYDSFERGASLDGEASALKIISSEYAYQVFQDLRSIFGSRYPFMTTALDLVTCLDSMFEPTLYSRVRIGEESIRRYKQSNLFLEEQNAFLRAPIFSVRNYLKHRKLRNMEDALTKEMTKYVHHHFHGACEWVESCMNRLEYSTNSLLNQHKEEIFDRHIDLDRVATVSIDIYKMICILSRANHSWCYGLSNNDAEKELAIAICKETFLKHLQIFEDISRQTLSDNDEFAKNVFNANLHENGYFASLFRIPK